MDRQRFGAARWCAQRGGHRLPSSGGYELAGLAPGPYREYARANSYLEAQ